MGKPKKISHRKERGCRDNRGNKQAQLSGSAHEPSTLLEMEPPQFKTVWRAARHQSRATPPVAYRRLERRARMNGALDATLTDRSPTSRWPRENLRPAPNTARTNRPSRPAGTSCQNVCRGKPRLHSRAEEDGLQPLSPAYRWRRVRVPYMNRSGMRVMQQWCPRTTQWMSCLLIAAALRIVVGGAVDARAAAGLVPAVGTMPPDSLATSIAATGCVGDCNGDGA